MAKTATTRHAQRHKTATREVTVKLFGWKGEVKLLSVVEEYWAVNLEFKMPKGNILTTTVFESEDYDLALAKYQAYVKIVED